ncbi:MAG: DUF1549 domain-containing protein, partial [Planctomycetota bacterium]
MKLAKTRFPTLGWLTGLILLASRLAFVQDLSLAQEISPAPKAAIEPDFASQIKPILANHCWSCHGPDEQARKADLRLDRRDDALASVAFVPGNASESSLIARIESNDPHEQMPPPEFKKPLSLQDRQLLKAWIDAGGKYSQHWAFTPPKISNLEINNLANPAATNPTGTNPTGTNNTAHRIDALVARELENHGVKPSGPADPATLLRRASLDLTGLPPTIEELDAFLKDPSEEAYESAIDRLLQSDAYAERMASQWLDLARYADTNGYNNDEDRQMWPWRDWVIQAFRNNMPYDQFITEQLAGDLLPEANLQQQVATGFLRNQGHNTEGGIIQEEYRVEYVADRVHTVATVFLGLSMQCARCHDHKVDPISQAEYYRFFSLVNNLEEKQASYSNFVGAEPFVRVPTVELIEQKNRLNAQLEPIRAQIDSKEKQLENTFTAWVAANSDATIQKSLGTTQIDYADFEPATESATESTLTATWSNPESLNRELGKIGSAVTLEPGRFLISNAFGKLDADRPFSISLWVRVP